MKIKSTLLVINSFASPILAVLASLGYNLITSEKINPKFIHDDNYRSAMALSSLADFVLVFYSLIFGCLVGFVFSAIHVWKHGSSGITALSAVWNLSIALLFIIRISIL